MTKYKALPSQEYLHELFDYSIITGELYWKGAKPYNPAGSVAGSVNKRGYREIGIDGVRYRAHRLIWKWITGEDPEVFMIDHKDTDKGNNAWLNLRLAVRSHNNANRSKPHKGCRQRPNGTFTASITFDGKSRCLGTYQTLEEAQQAFRQAHKDLHKEFSPYNDD